MFAHAPPTFPSNGVAGGVLFAYSEGGDILKRNKRNGDHHWEDFKPLMINETVRDNGKEQTPTALQYQPY